jgi:hypothetical protein
VLPTNGEDILEILPTEAHFPIPGMGFLPVNAFVIKAREPVLIDTGMGKIEAITP